MRRRPETSVAEVVRDAARVCVIDGVTDATNIGAIFRSAAALGMDAVVLSRTACDPLNRRAVRVSMGSVFLVPWAWSAEPVAELQALGFRTAAMALTDRSISLDDPVLKAEPCLALVMGTEGDGLADTVIASTDYTVRIPHVSQCGLAQCGCGFGSGFLGVTEEVKRALRTHRDLSVESPCSLPQYNRQ